MLAQFRKLAKSPVATALIAVLMASFALWGIRDVFRNVTVGDSVIQAGARSVDGPRFRQMFEQELQSYAQQTGQNISVQDAVKNNLDHQVADAIASDEAFAEYLRRAGLHASDKMIVDEIRKGPRFFNPISGAFDKQAYEQFVHQQLNMTDAQFEGMLRDDLDQTQFISGVAAAMRAPLLYGALVAAAQHEGRTFSYFVLPPTAVPPPKPPTDAQLNTFVQQNAERLKRPEMRLLTVVRFSTSAAEPGVTVNPADVQKRFDFEKDALSTPEKRSLIQIPAKTAADASAAAVRLKRGEDPAAVAKSLGTQPIVYNDSPKTAIADRKIADAAFAMAPGVSGPVQGDLGLSVLKLVQVTPGHVATLDEARPKIEAEIRKDAAQAKIDQQVRKFEDARTGGASLAEAAKQVGAATAQIGPITAQGLTEQSQATPAAPPKLVQAAFALSAGGDSDVVDLGQGEYAAVQVDKIIAPAVPPLNELRPFLSRYLMAHDAETRLQAKAAGIADQVRKGQTMEAAAAAAGVALGHGVGVERVNAGQTFSADLLGQLFTAKPGEVVVGQDVKPGAAVVARLQAVVPAAGPTVAQDAANQRLAMTRGLLQDLGQASREAARAAVKPRINYQRARAALGGDQGTP